MLEMLQDFFELHSLPHCLETVPGFVSLVKELKKRRALNLHFQLLCGWNGKRALRHQKELAM